MYLKLGVELLESRGEHARSRPMVRADVRWGLGGNVIRRELPPPAFSLVLGQLKKNTPVGWYVGKTYNALILSVIQQKLLSIFHIPRNHIPL
jgi:hypothetical protein